jgi:hypothetical protein
MIKFYEISTDKYIPLSHENQYLFKKYDDISNFISLYLGKEYRDILAKPIQNGYVVEWYSTYENLKDVRENKEFADTSYNQYFEFQEKLSEKIKQLSLSKNIDNLDWAKILKQVFNSEDNIIFGNSNNITIIWGWEFKNNKIYKPDIRTNLKKQDCELIKSIEEQNENQFNPWEDKIEEKVEEKLDYEFEDEILDLKDLHEVDLPIVEEKRFNFLEFLKWFASKFWWLIILFLFLISLIFTFKSLTY